MSMPIPDPPQPVMPKIENGMPPVKAGVDASMAIKYVMNRIDALQESLAMIIAQIVLKEQDETYDGQLMTMATQILGTLRDGDKAVRDLLGIEDLPK